MLDSRSEWVVVGNAGTFLSALVGLVHYWSRPLSFAGCAVIQLACPACQAVALIPVARPGRVGEWVRSLPECAPRSPGGRAHPANPGTSASGPVSRTRTKRTGCRYPTFVPLGGPPGQAGVGASAWG